MAKYEKWAIKEFLLSGFGDVCYLASRVLDGSCVFQFLSVSVYYFLLL